MHESACLCKCVCTSCLTNSHVLLCFSSSCHSCMDLPGGDEIWVTAGENDLADMEAMEKKWYCSSKHGRYVSYAIHLVQATEKQPSHSLPTSPSHLDLQLANLISLGLQHQRPRGSVRRVHWPTVEAELQQLRSSNRPSDLGKKRTAEAALSEEPASPTGKKSVCTCECCQENTSSLVQLAVQGSSLSNSVGKNFFLRFLEKVLPSEFEVCMTGFPATSPKECLDLLESRHSAAVPLKSVSSAEEIVLFGTPDLLVLKDKRVLAVVEITKEGKKCTKCSTTQSAITTQSQLASNVFSELYCNKYLTNTAGSVAGIALHWCVIHLYIAHIQSNGQLVFESYCDYDLRKGSALCEFSSQLSGILATFQKIHE